MNGDEKIKCLSCKIFGLSKLDLNKSSNDNDFSVIRRIHNFVKQLIQIEKYLCH